MKTYKHKKATELILLHEDEVPLLIKKLYHEHNKENTCSKCGNKAEYIGLEVTDKTKVRAFKLCRRCLRQQKYGVSLL